MKKGSLKYYLGWAILTGAYAWLSIHAPVAANAKYQFTSIQRTELLLTIIVPLSLIWLAAVYGSARFKAYAKGIINSADGKALNTIANGIALLAFGLMTSSVVQTWRTTALRDGYIATFNIAYNYFYVGFYLLGFYIVYRGSKQLVALTKADKQQANGLRRSLLPMTLVSALYAWGFRANPYLSSTPDPANAQSYYLPAIVVLLTIVFPYLLTWCLGVMAVINIRTYMENTRGTVYKQALQSLGNGVFGVVVFSILAQLLTGLTTFFQNQGSVVILVAVYILVVLYAVGYLMIADGARKLSRIEEVT